jgi:hypothetical protein
MAGAMSAKITIFVCVAVVLAGYGCDKMGLSAAERERRKLLSECEAVRKGYTSGALVGDCERCDELFDLSSNLYSKALAWQRKYSCTAEDKALVEELNKYTQAWIADVDRRYQESHSLVHNGSSPLIFVLQEDMLERTIFYNKGTYRLLMSPNEKRSWHRIENAEWRMHGKLIKFSNGVACALLDWRLFAPSPFIDDYGWRISIEENSVFHNNDFDYAIVWFAGDGNLIGCPTTTEERAFVEIKQGRIIRWVGLHNIVEPVSLSANEHNQVTITAEIGGSHFEKVKYVIDLKRMKIIKSQSVLSHDFPRDGYDKLFAE